MNQIYWAVPLFAIGVILFALIGQFASKLLSRSAPNPEKLTPYECGEEPTGSPYGKFNVRFMLIALVFVLFEVELIFLFPMVTLSKLFPSIKWLIISEVVVFLAVLAIGWAYAYRFGFLDWVRPEPSVTSVNPVADASQYADFNKQYLTKPNTNKKTGDKQLVN